MKLLKNKYSEALLGDTFVTIRGAAMVSTPRLFLKLHVPSFRDNSRVGIELMQRHYNVQVVHVYGICVVLL